VNQQQAAAHAEHARDGRNVAQRPTSVELAGFRQPKVVVGVHTAAGQEEHADLCVSSFCSGKKCVPGSK
jgi:hypothetical protein